MDVLRTVSGDRHDLEVCHSSAVLIRCSSKHVSLREVHGSRARAKAKTITNDVKRKMVAKACKSQQKAKTCKVFLGAPCCMLLHVVPFCQLQTRTKETYAQGIDWNETRCPRHMVYVIRCLSLSGERDGSVRTSLFGASRMKNAQLYRRWFSSLYIWSVVCMQIRKSCGQQPDNLARSAQKKDKSVCPMHRSWADASLPMFCVASAARTQCRGISALACRLGGGRGAGMGP